LASSHGAGIFFLAAVALAGVFALLLVGLFRLGKFVSPNSANLVMYGFLNGLAVIIFYWPSSSI